MVVRDNFRRNTDKIGPKLLKIEVITAESNQLFKFLQKNQSKYTLFKDSSKTIKDFQLKFCNVAFGKMDSIGSYFRYTKLQIDRKELRKA